MPAWKSLRLSESEAEFRQLWSYFYEQVSTGKAKTGVVSGLAVTATTPSASGSVNVDTGLAVCQPTTGGGAFPLPNTSGLLDVFTANPMQFVGNPRNDIVILDQVDGTVKTLTGTPNANAALGEQTVPATAVPLARLRHAANATTIPAAKIDDLRVTVKPFGVPSVPTVQSGTVVLTGDATNQRFLDLTFPTAFPSTPIIWLQSLTGMTTSGTTQSVWPSGESATGVRINAVRNNTTAVSVRWVALLP